LHRRAADENSQARRQRIALGVVWLNCDRAARAERLNRRADRHIEPRLCAVQFGDAMFR